MKNRPRSVTIIAALFIAVGVLGMIGHFMDFKIQHPFQYDILWVALVHVLAVVAGVYMLLGNNWARWLAILWMAFHVAISAGKLPPLAIHTLLFITLAYFLFRKDAREYFRGAVTQADTRVEKG